MDVFKDEVYPPFPLFPSPLGGGPFNFQGGGGLEFFLINNFGRTLREINDLLQELFYINM